MKNDINKFVWQQMLSNSDGKTSASGTAGLLCIVVGLIGFLFGVEEMWRQGKSDTMTQSIVVIGMGASLLGYRKSHDGNLAKMIESQPDSDAKTEELPGPPADAAHPPMQ